MRCGVCWITAALVLACSGQLGAGPWVKVVEEIAERAAGAEARTAQRRLVIRETEEVSGILARRAAPSLEEAALLRRFERLQGVDDALRAEFKSLLPAERRLAVELGEGAQRVLRLYPGRDGARVLQHLDAAGLAQSRTYGDFVIDGMAWLQSDEALAALRAPISDEAGSALARTLGLKSVPAELSEREVASLWKSAVRKTGDGAGEFWRTYVAPHKGKWLAGGLLVTYLAMPEKFHDAAGKLTEYGAREIAKLLGNSAIGAGRGLLGGVGDSVKRHYAEAPVMTVLTVALIVVLLSLAVPRLRWLVWHKGLRRLLATPTGPAAARAAVSGGQPSALPTHTPLKE